MSVAIKNSWHMKIISFGCGIDLKPGVNTIKDPEQIRYLRKNEVALKGYCEAILPGTDRTVLAITAGSIHDPIEGDAPAAKGKQTVPIDKYIFEDVPQKDALLQISIMVDVDTLEDIVKRDKRPNVKKAAKDTLAKLREV